jgi:hypothetical protein
MEISPIRLIEIFGLPQYGVLPNKPAGWDYA